MPDDHFSDDDSFWDVKHLMPKHPLEKSVSFPVQKPASARAKSSPSKTAKERINATGEKIPAFSQNKPENIYRPQNSHIHEVRLYRWPNRYTFFSEFKKNAIAIYKMAAEPAPFAPFFSFMPQYHQLTAAQLKYYLFWRDRFRQGEYLQTDFSYLLLFAYEIVNLPELLPPQEGANALCNLWIAYRKNYPKLDKYLSEWLCDYCLVNAVRPNEELFEKIAEHGKTFCTLKEFYITEAESTVPSILSSNYSYKGSKYYTEENKALFDLHIPNAVTAFIDHMASADPHFIEQPEEETTVSRNSYDGAVCVYSEKKRMELVVSLCKPSGDTLLITDAVRYAENHLRAFLGVRARLSSSSLTTSMKAAIDRYFERLPHARPIKKAVIDDSYLAKYDADSHGFSTEDAKKIETDSIIVAKRLGAMYEEEQPLPPIIPPQVKEVKKGGSNEETAALKILYLDGHDAFLRHAKDQGILPAALADRINEEAIDRYGDVAIEESNGRFTMIEDYKEEIEQWINN